MSRDDLKTLRENVRRHRDDAEAWAALEAADPDAAIEEVARALMADPRNVELQLLAATVSERRGALTDAADHLAAVLAVEADHLEANRRLGVLLGRLGDNRGAIRRWRRVVALTALEDLEALTALGIGLSTDGQHGEAIEILTEVATRREGVSASHADLGMALLAASRLDEALVAFGRARDLDPTSAQAHCGMGLVYQQQGRWWEAADAFRHTEELAPENPVGPMNLGVALETLGEHDQARSALLRAAALAPDDVEIRAALEQLAVPQVVQDEVTRPTLQAEQFDASIAGDLKTFQLLDVLEFLRLQAKSGSLVVSSRQGAGLVRIVKGKFTSASAPGLKRLGETLVARGMITVAQLETALAKQQDDQEETLGSLLLRAGAIDAPKLAEVVLAQMMSALEELLNWTEGAFSFHGGPDKDPPPIAFDMQKVMLKLMKIRDERQRPARTSA